MTVHFILCEVDRECLPVPTAARRGSWLSLQAVDSVLFFVFMKRTDANGYMSPLLLRTAMAVITLPPAVAAVLFGVAGGLVGFLIALVLKRRIPGRFAILITAAIAGVASELISGALGELTGNGAVVLTARLIGLFMGGAMFRFTFKGHFGSTADWMTPYLASSFASWTAFAMSLEIVGVVSVMAAIIGGFCASTLGRAVSRYLPSTVEQASAMTQIAGLSWLLGFVAYSLGIVVIYASTGSLTLTPFGIFAASSVALLLSVLLALPYVSRQRVYARLTARMSRLWKYLGSFILLFLFIALLILVGYQKAFSPIILLIALAGGLIAGLLSGLISYYFSKERKGIPPQTFSAILLGISAGQGIGVIASISLDTFITRLYSDTILELIFLSGLSATVAGFLFSVWRVRRAAPAAEIPIAAPVEAATVIPSQNETEPKPPT